jgi:hypothetical protein
VSMFRPERQRLFAILGKDLARPHINKVVAGTWMLISSLLPGNLTRAQEDPEDLTIRAMCRSGLTVSAVEYVTARRRLVATEPSARAKWTMRLMECHAFAALHSVADAESHWQLCQSVMQDFVASDTQNARLPWLEWQRSRCDLLRAQADVAQFLAAPANTQSRESALVLVRKILTDLERLEEDIQRRQPLAARQGLKDGPEAPADQLHKLGVDTVLLRCEALLIRARLYDSGAPDRVAAATDVDRQATDVLQRTEPDWPSRDQLLVAQAIARLDLGQSDTALTQLEQLARASNNPQARARAAMIAVQYLAAHQQASRAQPLLSILRSAGGGPELELAEIEIALSEIETKQEQAKQQALGQLLEKSKQLGTRYGDYWQSRAEALLIGSIPIASMSSNTNIAADLLAVEVRQLLAAGDEPAAIGKLLQFRDNELASGHDASALKVAAQAAALYQRQGDWLAASQTLSSVSKQLVETDGAAEAHVQAIFCMSQALRADVRNAEVRQAYESLLEQQLLTWPDAAATDESESWLTTWLAGQQRSSELAAILLKRAIAASQAEMMQRSLMRWLGIVLDDETLMREQLASLSTAIDAQQFGEHQRVAELVQIVVQSVEAWPTAAESNEWVRAISQLASSEDTPEVQQLTIFVRLLCAIRINDAGMDLASTLWSQWQPSQLTPAIRLGIARPLIAAIDETPWQAHAELARRARMDSDWSTLLIKNPSPLAQAAGYRMLAWLQDPVAALEGLKTLADKATRAGGELQLQLANALADSGPNRLEDSSQIAKLVAANSPAGSELNLAARWRLLKNLRQAGQLADAQRAAQLLIATQPMPSEIWRTRFERISK